jgi:hypothetical protein
MRSNEKAHSDPDLNFLAGREMETHFARLQARIKANLLQTNDGRNWNTGLVVSVLNDIQTLNGQVLSAATLPAHQQILIMNRELIGAEIRDSMSWQSYTPGTIAKVLTRLAANTDRAFEMSFSNFRN